MNEVLEKINGKLVVSCQANDEINPFHSPEEMLKMAQAGKIGGCVGFRANMPENVKIIKEAFPDMPMIGIWKVVTEGCDVYITPTMKEVDVLREIGSDIIAVDGTDRYNCEGKKAYELIREIKEKYPDQLVMADIATINDARKCVEAGADIISTTLSGYTLESELNSPIDSPDFALLEKLTKNLDIPIILEGKIWNCEDVKKAFELKAYSVVIGSAVTRPQLIVKRFNEKCILGAS